MSLKEEDRRIIVTLELERVDKTFSMSCRHAKYSSLWN